MPKWLKRHFNIYGIRTFLILSFILLISTVVLFLSLVSYRYNVGDLERMSISYTMRLLSEINASIDAYVDNMKSMARVVVEHDDVRELMSFYNRNRSGRLSYLEDQELEALTARACAHMDVVANTRRDITNIAVISKYGDVVLSDRDKEVNPYSEYNLTDWFLKPLSYKDDMVVSPSHVQNLIAGEYRWVISISKAITDAETGEVTGVMVIDLNYRSIEDICENSQLEKSGYIYLADDKQNLIYHPQQQLIYSGIKAEPVAEVLRLDGPNIYLRSDDRSKIYTRHRSDVTGWSAVGVVNSAKLLQGKNSLMNFYLLLMAICIPFASVLAVIISTTVTHPIRRLEQTMHRAEQGDLTVRSDIGVNNEIGHLGRTFNGMLGRIGQLMDNAVAAEEAKRRSEIKALQAQINPHFLYNTLETIIWMAASGRNDEVMEVTSALARLFRTSISRDGSLVALEVELENIGSYLTIQKMRYKDTLSFAVEVPDSLRGLLVPRLILQPIVENSLYHGLKPSPGGGFIRIEGRREGELLLLSIRDDGVGMSPEQLEGIFVPPPDGAHGIGVTNVHERIRLCFGEEYGLRYQSSPGKGTLVEIRLPAVEQQREEACHD